MSDSFHTINRVAIIPARGGSKRLPRKNILPLGGKPMVAYPISTALESGLFSQVIVSTEDSEISELAQQAGARVINRPNDLAGDIVGVVDVCLQVLNTLEEEGACPDVFCCLYATAAFLNIEDLKKSCLLLEESGDVDIIMGVSEYDIHPYKAMSISPSADLEPMWPDKILKKSQQLPNFVASNGTLYWARTGYFRNTPLFYGEHMKGYVVPFGRAIDIDTPDDYERAKHLVGIRAS